MSKKVLTLNVLKSLIYIICGFLIVFSSCKKETEDNIKPTISLTSPLNAQFYTALDVISIKGIISDETSLELISISLNNGNNISVASSITLTPNTKEKLLDEVIVIDNINLESGQYYIKVVANDGTNTTSEFINININEYPKKRLGVFVFSNPGSNTSITMLDSLLNASNHATISGDFLNGFVNSQTQEVISCGKLTGDLKGIDIMSGSENWAINNPSSVSSYFTAIEMGNNELFLNNYDRNIQSYIGSGQPNFNGQALVNKHSTLAYVHEELLITEQIENLGPSISLVAYYLSTGAEKQNLVINEDVVKMFSNTLNEVVLFTNSGGNGMAKIFDINQNSVWQPFSLSAGLIEDCTEISTGLYAIIQNGDIRVVDINGFSETLYLAGVNASKVKYDKITNQLFIASGVELSVYDYSSKIKMASYNHSEAILDFDFWYNK